MCVLGHGCGFRLGVFAALVFELALERGYGFLVAFFLVLVLLEAVLYLFELTLDLGVVQGVFFLDLALQLFDGVLGFGVIALLGLHLVL